MSDAKIIDSWGKNAEPWTRAVRENRIESRVRVTNAAVVDAVLDRTPRSVLDVGCGEGWLVRALASHGVRGIGIDVVPELVARAAEGGGGEFSVASYEDIVAGRLNVRVDTIVANFSLIGHESVDRLMAVLHRLLNPGGRLVIQTLHPVIATIGTPHPYVDGWRDGSWAGCGSDFIDPAPWYFRTVSRWVQLLAECKWHLLEIREPVHPATRQPVSIIFIAQGAG